MNRHVLFLLAAAGSFGVPMMTSNSNIDDAFQNTGATSGAAGAAMGDPSITTLPPLSPNNSATLNSASLGSVQGMPQGQFAGSVATPPITGRVLKSTTLTGPEAIPFTELLRFEITPDWIMQHWTRVSTVTEQPTLQGYRVPVVTGTQPFDLAGSLSYFFNDKQELQRIVFHGTTGDARPLVQWVTQAHELTPQSSSQAGLQLYQRQWHGKPVSELRVAHAPVVQQEAAFTKYQVDLLLERPAGSTIFKPGETSGPSWRL